MFSNAGSMRMHIYPAQHFMVMVDVALPAAALAHGLVSPRNPFAWQWGARAGLAGFVVVAHPARAG